MRNLSTYYVFNVRMMMCRPFVQFYPSHSIFIWFQHPDGSISSWASVRGLFQLEQGLAIRKAPQLTTEHVNPAPTRRMNVRLAAQVFSHRTAAAMRSSSENLPPTANRTANLLEMFNDMFDFLNSNNLKEVGTRRPAMTQLWSAQKEVSTINILEYCETICIDSHIANIPSSY